MMIISYQNQLLIYFYLFYIKFETIANSVNDNMNAYPIEDIFEKLKESNFIGLLKAQYTRNDEFLKKFSHYDGFSIQQDLLTII